MRRIQSVIGIVLFCLVLNGWSADTKNSLPKPDYNRIQKAIGHLSKTIGPRAAGSEAELQAIDYISNELKGMGYHLSYQMYRLPDYKTTQTIHAYYGTTTRREDTREVFLCANIDTLPHSPGANQNASGVAILMELARIIREKQIPVGVNFLFLGAEENIPEYENGKYLSSAQYIEYQKSLGLDFVDGFIMVNSAGAGDKLQITQVKGAKPDIANKLSGIAAKLKLPLELNTTERWQESMPYEDAGVSTAWLGWSTPSNQKAEQDIADKISRKKLESVVILLENLLIPTD